jgi:nitroimidazol reductase NimA-like FMN-containing flavoprotein (pyridoxamine 5'-phosphate oxidase superfamily)
MFIHDMTEAECRRALETANVGRLACAQDNQPYVVPIYFAYSGRYLYAFSTIGQKIEWMRANPRVCLEVDEINSPDEWMSLVVFGRYEELQNVPDSKSAREQALTLLQMRSRWWWEPASICDDHRDSPHSCIPVAYRIHIDRVSGQRATPDIIETKEIPVDESPVKRSWLARIFRPGRSANSRRRNIK